jgi:TDG/mug DNA glycosylase family protein
MSRLSSRGHRATISWMGRRVKTLKDLPSRAGGILVVGINPAVVSVKAGHYYQGTLGRRLWARLERLGLLEEAVAGTEDEAFVASGHGLSDIVKRPTATAAELSPDELRYGADRLRRSLRSWRPRMIVFPFGQAARYLAGRTVPPGIGPEIEGIPTFRLTGPYAASAKTERNDEELRQLLELPRAAQSASSRVKAPSPAERSRPKAGTASPTRRSRNVHSLSQRVTKVDKRAGRIRFPKDAKRFFPRQRAQVHVLLRGSAFAGRYDPRAGPEGERSAVFQLGRAALALVDTDDRLRVSIGNDGVVHLD